MFSEAAPLSQDDGDEVSSKTELPKSANKQLGFSWVQKALTNDITEKSQDVLDRLSQIRYNSSTYNRRIPQSELAPPWYTCV